MTRSRTTITVVALAAGVIALLGITGCTGTNPAPAITAADRSVPWTVHSVFTQGDGPVQVDINAHYWVGDHALRTITAKLNREYGAGRGVQVNVICPTNDPWINHSMGGAGMTAAGVYTPNQTDPTLAAVFKTGRAECLKAHGPWTQPVS